MTRSAVATSFQQRERMLRFVPFFAVFLLIPQFVIAQGNALPTTDHAILFIDEIAEHAPPVHTRVDVSLTPGAAIVRDASLPTGSLRWSDHPFGTVSSILVVYDGPLTRGTHLIHAPLPSSNVLPRIYFAVELREPYRSWSTHEGSMVVRAITPTRLAGSLRLSFTANADATGTTSAHQVTYRVRIEFDLATH